MNPPLEGDISVEARAIGTSPNDWAVDAEGDEVGWGPALDTRLRLGGEVHGGSLRAHGQIDLLTGQIAGATWSLSPMDERGRDVRDAVSLTGIAPREALVGARLPWFDLEVGLTTAGWGLGMVANDGATDPLFGRSDFGDRAIRARLATAPFARGEERFPLFVLVAADRVVADDLASMWDGDVAWQGIAAALYREEDRGAGVYGVIRDQVSAEGDHTAAKVVDGYADWTVHPAGLDLRLAFEAAALFGRTDAATSYVAPDGLTIRQQGLAVRTELGHDPWRLHLRAALASGDGSPDDDRVSDFRFDRDYDVGFVLFDEVLGDIALGTIPLVSDPDLAQHPPDGVEVLADEGAFRSAFALQPIGTLDPLPWLQLRGGAVFAWSTQPIEQLYYTFRNGGVPTNQLGEPTDGRYLGTEIDWGFSMATVGDARWRGQLDLQAGHALPSAALGGGRVDHVLLLARVTR